MPAPGPKTTQHRPSRVGACWAISSMACGLRSMSSGPAGSNDGACGSSRAVNTRPAPKARAAREASRAAPVMPAAPPKSNTSPRSPLCAADPGCGNAAMASAPLRSMAVAWVWGSGVRVSEPLSCSGNVPWRTGKPAANRRCREVALSPGSPHASRSSSQSSPQAWMSGPVSRPGLRPSRVSVTSARTNSPGAVPVALAKPEGRSTARTGAGCCARAVMAAANSPSGARLRPMPSKASRMRSTPSHADVAASCVQGKGRKPAL